ncbi:MAG: S8 family serine peptidase [Oligoflexia bacterium]|nr:S8 family serine peptidase [Oligoflexia bacterium]
MPKIAPLDTVIIGFKEKIPETLKSEKFTLINDKRQFRSANIARFKVNGVNDINELFLLVESIKAVENVESAEPDYFAGLHTSDPHYALQWALNSTGREHGGYDTDINFPEAVRETRSVKPVVKYVRVAIIDDGIDISHPDISRCVWKNELEIPSNNTDDDNNGFVDDISGWNFTENNNRHGGGRHGTAVTGIICAKNDNARGIAGVAENAKVMPLTVFNDNGKARISDIVSAIEYAVIHNAVVINMPLGLDVKSVFLEKAMRWACLREILFSLSAGNDSSDIDKSPTYPASYTLDRCAIVTAASNVHGTVSFGSNYGVKTVDIVAPGEQIYTTLPGPSYGYLDGTSLAASYTSGVLAFALYRFAVKPAVLVSMIKKTSRPSFTATHPVKYGLADMWALVRMLKENYTDISSETKKLSELAIRKNKLLKFVTSQQPAVGNNTLLDQSIKDIAAIDREISGLLKKIAAIKKEQGMTEAVREQ